MPKYEIYALKYAGPFTSSGSFLLWLRDVDKIVEREYFIWCIKGPSETFIVDAGVSPAFAFNANTKAAEVGSRLGFKADASTSLKGYTNPAEMLSRIGVKADEVRHVILTHLHWDHSSGVDLFPNAVFYIQEQEFNFWVKNEIANSPPFKFIKDDVSLAYLASLEGTDRLVLLKGDQEIFPGIECLLAPGHSVGLQVVAVDTAKGTAIVGSDCAHTFQNYTESWPSSLIVDLVGWVKTYRKLRAKASSLDLLFPGHDPLMLKNYPEIAKDIARLV